VPSGGLALDVEPVGMDSVGRRGNGLNPEGATMPASCVDEDMKSARTSTTATKQETKVSTASPISRGLACRTRRIARPMCAALCASNVAGSPPSLPPT
jgi:hypothetical protein